MARLPRSLSYGMAVLIAMPGVGSALELGDAVVASALGQPLEIEVRYRLAPDERLAASCVGLVPSTAAAALPTYTSTGRVLVGPTHIRILGAERVLEPLIAVNLSVRCATVPKIVRSYQLFVDPPAVSGAPLVSVPAPAPEVPLPASSSTVPSEREPPRAAVIGEPARAARPATAPRGRSELAASLEQGAVYRVLRGDTLSGIAARVAARPGNVWQTAEAIFAANPEAFAQGSPDLLLEGRSIVIPVLGPRVAVAAVEGAPERIVAVPPPVSAAAEPAAAVPARASAAAPPSVELPPASPMAPATPAEAPSASLTAASAPTPVVEQPVAVTPAPLEPRVAPSAAAPDGEPAAPGVEPAAPGVEPAAAAPLSLWLGMLLAFGAGLAVAGAPSFIARRRRAREEEAPLATEEPPRAVPVRMPPPTPLATDGIEVEYPPVTVARTAPESLERDAALEAAPNWPAELPAEARLEAQPVDIGVAGGEGVDLDIGAPLDASETAERPMVRVEDTVSGPTAIMPDVAASTTVRTARREPEQRPVARKPDGDTSEINTMTVADLDLLRKDYEYEHTLTQQLSAELADAVRDLEATKQALAANAESTTVLQPRQPSADPATEPTAIQPRRRKKRSLANE